MKYNHFADTRLLRLNVGFLLKEGAGYSRDIEFDEAGPILAEEVELVSLQGTLRLTRTPQGILVKGILSAKTATECVRCLSPISHPFAVEISELFALPTSPHAEASQFLIDEGFFIDLRPILREEAILAIPIHMVCSPDCKGLCPHCGQNLNQGTCSCESDHIDPRLAALRALLDE